MFPPVFVFVGPGEYLNSAQMGAVIQPMPTKDISSILSASALVSQHGQTVTLSVLPAVSQCVL